MLDTILVAEAKWDWTEEGEKLWFCVICLRAAIEAFTTYYNIQTKSTTNPLE